jgi:translocation and assembly module TamB
MRWRALFLAVSLATPAVAQDDDRGILTRFIEDNLSGAGRTVRVEGFEGALSSRARVAEITIADEAGIWLRMTGIELDWTRAALFSGRLEIDRLTAREIALERPPLPGPAALPSPEAVPFALPDLPVSVRIGAIGAERVTLGPAVLGTPLAVRLDGAADLAGGEGTARLVAERIDGQAGRIDLSGAFSNATRELALDLLAEEAAGGIAAGLIGVPGSPALRLAVAGAGPIDAYTARVALASDGVDRLAGSVTLVAEGGARGFRVDLQGDVAPLFLPDYRDFFGPDVALLAEGRREATGATELAALRIVAAEVAVDGRARIGADGLPQRLDLTLRIAGAGGAPVVLPLPGPQTRVAGADLSLRYNAIEGEAWRLSGRLDGLEHPDLAAGQVRLSGSGRIGRLPGGRAVTGGTLRLAAEALQIADPGLAAALGERVEGGTRFDWSEGGVLRLPDLRLAAAGLALDAGIEIDAETRSLAGRFAATVDDFARLSVLAGRDLGGRGRIAWEGRLAPLDGMADGVLTASGTGLRTGLAELDGLLQGPSELRLDAARGTGGVEIRALTAEAGTLSARLSGWLRSGGSELSGRVGLTDLSALGPRYGGRAVAELRLVQALGSERLDLTAATTDLALGQAELDALLRGETRLVLAARRTGPDWVLERLRLDAPSVAAEVQGALAGGDRRLDVRAILPDAAALGPRYGGRVEAQARYSATGGVEQLDATASSQDLSVGIAEADRILAGAGRLRLAATRRDGALRVEVLQAALPRLTLDGTAVADNGGRRLDLEGRLSDLALVVPGIPGPLTLSGRIGEAGARGLSLDLALVGPGGIDARARGTVAADFARADLTLAGRAEAALANAFVAPLSLAGPVTFDLRLAGRPALAGLSGTASFGTGRVVLADPPLAVSGVSATAVLAGGRARLSVSGTADPGGGTVTAEGSVALEGGNAADLGVTLAGFALRDPDLYATRASGALRVTGPLAGGARIAGRLTLSETEIRVPSTGLGGVADIPDLRHRNEPAAVRATRARAGLAGTGDGATGAGRAARPHALDIAVSAPNAIFVRGRGLDAELGGDLLLRGTTAAVIPSGGFSLLRGRLDILGRRFTLDEGQLALAGALVPQIRLAASTRSESVTARILVEGPADAPSIRFVSTPELPEEEVVALLLFGRGLRSISALQAAQLASAVATLTGRGGPGVVDRLRRSFGLDDLDLAAAADGSTTLRAGKYLSENLYADVLFGAEGRSTVTLNLDVSPSVTVRGSAGSDGETGIGIYFERDY